MTCTVLSLLPTNEILAIRNCEMTLELMLPLDTPIPEPPMAQTVPLLPTAETTDDVPIHEPVQQEDPVIRRQRMAEAARARFLGDKK
jgi:hypothetical protein